MIDWVISYHRLNDTSEWYETTEMTAFENVRHFIKPLLATLPSHTQQLTGFVFIMIARHDVQLENISALVLVIWFHLFLRKLKLFQIFLIVFSSIELIWLRKVGFRSVQLCSWLLTEWSGISAALCVLCVVLDPNIFFYYKVTDFYFYAKRAETIYDCCRFIVTLTSITICRKFSLTFPRNSIQIYWKYVLPWYDIKFLIYECGSMCDFFS